MAGRYRLGALLGRGGSADVYEAHDEVLDRPVAVKVTREPGDRALLTQARAVSRLVHPGIARVLDAGVDDGHAWAAFELVAGPSAAALVAAYAPPETGQAVAAAVAVLGALQYAHGLGVVHGDLAPANVVVPLAGVEPVWDRAVLVDLASDTRAGDDVVVSPHYAAPEVATGGRPTPRSDVYSVGAVLTFLLTSAPPFDRPPDQALAAQVHDTPPPVTARRPELPAELDAIVLRALAKDPDDRWPDAAAMATRLAAVRTGGRTSLFPPLPVPAVRSGTQQLPVVASALPAPVVPLEPAGRPGRRRGGAVVTSLLLTVAVGAGIAAAANRSDSSIAIPTPTVTFQSVAVPTAAAPSSAPPPTASATPTTALDVLVPDVVAGNLDAARSALAREGLVLGTVQEVDAAAAAGTVRQVYPAVGTKVSAGSLVDVALASGFTAVPAVVGLTVDVATQRIAAAGLSVDVAVTQGEVTDQVPAQGIRLVVGGTVRLQVATSTVEATPTPTVTAFTSAAPSATRTP